MNNNDKFETKKFLLSPITFKPYFKNYSIITDKNLDKSSNIFNFQFLSQKIGNWSFKIDYSPNNK